MRWKKLLEWVLCISLSLLSLTGCWDQHPVEDRAAVAAIGVDPGPSASNYRFTVVFPNVTTTPSSLASSVASQQFYTVSVTAPNLLAALAQVQRRESRSLYLGQTRIVCLSSKLPIAVWRNTLNLMADSGRFVLTTWLVASPQAARVVTLAPPVEVVPEVGLYNALICRCQAIRWPGRSWRVWANMETEGISPTLVDVIVRHHRFILTHLVVMGSQHVQTWSPAASLGWAYLEGRVLRATSRITLQHTPMVVGLIRGGSHLGFELNRAGHITVHAALRYTGVLLGDPGGSDTLARDRLVEHAMASTIRAQVAAAWNMAQRSGTDPMGWHRDAAWSNAGIAEQVGHWANWTLKSRVTFRLREEGVLR